MLGFKKKKKEHTEGNTSEENNELSKTEYKIVLFEKLGGTVREIKTLYAQRWVDDEDKVVYLRNASKNLQFLEIFPQQIQDFKNYDEKEVKELIDTIQKQLKRERKNDSNEVNDKDLEFDLLKLRAKERSFKFGNKTSYLSFDEKGRATFHFLREGSTFFPFKWDTDTNTIFIPSDNRKKSASLALRNKENKYNTKKILSGIQILLLLIQLGALMATGWGYLKVIDKGNQINLDYDASNIAAAKRACLEEIGQTAADVERVASSVDKIVNSVSADLNKPQTVINGVIPE
jgi:hypothetical protein